LDYKFMSDLIDLGFPECINVVFINSDINSNITALILIWRGIINWWSISTAAQTSFRA